jgi:hypothetical protein
MPKFVLAVNKSDLYSSPVTAAQAKTEITKKIEAQM